MFEREVEVSLCLLKWLAVLLIFESAIVDMLRKLPIKVVGINE